MTQTHIQHNNQHDQFRRDVIDGLSHQKKSIPSKYLYDMQGARLFEKICDLEEYYLTRAELRLLKRHADDLRAMTTDSVCIVEFGSGATRKIRILLDAFGGGVTYIPVDICQHYLDESVSDLREDFADMAIVPFLGDFNEPLALPLPHGKHHLLGFFSGSTIGNLTQEQRVHFLCNARETLGDGSHLLLAADLRKSEEILHCAYNDKEGVTAAFNLNLLARANRDLNADFDLRSFKHEGIWNDADGRIEMHLVSLQNQDVRIDGHSFSFAEGESIHTENSHKFTRPQLEELAARCGWRLEHHWLDDQLPFSLNVLIAAGK